MFSGNTTIFRLMDYNIRPSTLKNYFEMGNYGVKNAIASIEMNSDNDVIENDTCKVIKNEKLCDLFRVMTKSGFSIDISNSNNIAIGVTSNKHDLITYANVDLIKEKIEKNDNLYAVLANPLRAWGISNVEDNRKGFFLALMLSSYSNLSNNNPSFKVIYDEKAAYEINTLYVDKATYKGFYDNSLYAIFKGNNDYYLVDPKVIDKKNKNIVYRELKSENGEDEQSLLQSIIETIIPNSIMEKYDSSSIGLGDNKIFDEKFANYLINTFSLGTLKSFIHFLYIIERGNFERGGFYIESKNELLIKTLNDISFYSGYKAYMEKNEDTSNYRLSFINERLNMSNYHISYDPIVSVKKISNLENTYDVKSMERLILMNQFMVLRDFD